MINAGSLHAKGTMVAALLKHLVVGAVLRITGHARSGRPWLDRMAAEGLGPTPPSTWEYIAASSRCIGCGVCDAAVTLSPESDLSRGSAADPAAGPRATVSEWMMGAARRPQDAAVVVEPLVRIEQVAEQIARVCPARLDPRTIVRLVRERAAALEGTAEGEDR